MDWNELKATSIFPVGQPNDAYARFFDGQSWLQSLSAEQVGIANVSFEPGCRNHWHIHHAKQGGGQILLVAVAVFRRSKGGFHQLIYGRSVRGCFLSDDHCYFLSSVSLRFSQKSSLPIFLRFR